MASRSFGKWLNFNRFVDDFQAQCNGDHVAGGLGLQQALYPCPMPGEKSRNPIPSSDSRPRIA